MGCREVGVTGYCACTALYRAQRRLYIIPPPSFIPSFLPPAQFNSFLSHSSQVALDPYHLPPPSSPLLFSPLTNKLNSTPPNKMTYSTTILFLLLPLLLFISFASTCTPPTGPLTPTFPAPFSIQVQNITYPQINNRFLNFWQAGGGDQHLYLSPAGTPVANLSLENGILQRAPDGVLQKLIVRAVINGEVSLPPSRKER